LLNVFSVAEKNVIYSKGKLLAKQQELALESRIKTYFFGIFEV